MYGQKSMLMKSPDFKGGFEVILHYMAGGDEFIAKNVVLSFEGIAEFSSKLVKRKLGQGEKWKIADELDTSLTNIVSSLGEKQTEKNWKLIPDVYTQKDFEVLFDIVKKEYKRRWGR